jgi:hypothetical protein
LLLTARKIAKNLLFIMDLQNKLESLRFMHHRPKKEIYGFVRYN